ncbi:MAG: class I SAM-dependent methyltransferase [Candidatus Omnitrophota bacterium]|jgi:ubiquinone/menaquinone biosynthesis C-methylase UbiE|nr:MAG: class I SAM-dependent methyltransferase [Candidatus Omnitrophota bacterium]
MGTLVQNLDSWSHYDWSQGGDEWSACWGGTDYLWTGTILPRIRAFLPTDTILELAPGFGRITQYLKDNCRHLIAVDLVERCIAACKSRFASSSHIEYHVNDGKSLPMIADGSIDFLISWDSMVHAESNVMKAYIDEFARILKPEGFGFIHHSNIGHYFLDKKEKVKNPHWRAESMSARLFAKYCDDAGLQCVSQELIGWGDTIHNDCFSLFTRNHSPYARPNQVFANENFMYEAGRLLQIANFYNPTNFKK